VPPAAPAGGAPLSAPRRRLAAAALTAVLAVVLRWWRHGVTFDVFVDEFVYQQLGSSVRDGGLPRLGDGPFFLHPPGFFYLVGAWEQLTGADVTSDPIQAVFNARELNGVLGGLTAGLLVWVMGRRSVARGLLPGLVFAIEPFALRQNGRVLL
jgi:hypothetical protein